VRRVHFIGIGGSGISALAGVELQRGAAVSGSDLRSNALTDGLTAAGARVFIGHKAEHVHGADLVVMSSAVKADNPEVIEARRLGISVLKRAWLPAMLMAGQLPIFIAGTHGKTTTTAMIALLLERTGQDPSYILGGTVSALGGNAHAGRGAHFVIEADEYDGMFLGLTPWVAVITNVELDHVDCYPTLADVKKAFVQFAGQTVPGGLILACRDDSGALDVAEQTQAQWSDGPTPTRWTYGLNGPADWSATDIVPADRGGSRFTVLQAGQPFGCFDLTIPGRHNVVNALAAVAVGAWVGLKPTEMAEALREYHGAGRRFEIKGEAAGVTVIDDYGHHPTEIKVTLRAARERFPGRRLWAVFQPHTYSRLQALFDEFAVSFTEADRVIVADVYAARERSDETISAAGLACRIVGPPAIYIPELKRVAEHLLTEVRPGDVIITLGAGDDDLIGEWVLDGLRRREADGGC